jgi:hypothetical protein
MTTVIPFKSEDAMYEAQNDPTKQRTTDPLVAAKETVQEIAEPLKEKALEVAKEQKDVGADQLKLLARAMQGASKAVADEVPQFASYVKKLSGTLERTSDSIREKELDELGETLSDFAKRNPALVFGGALLAGLTFSRFLKSSTQKTPAVP